MGILLFSHVCLAQCQTTTFQKTYGSSPTIRAEFAQSIVETPDHGFITGGWTNRDTAIFMKTDQKGDIVWSHRLTGGNTPVGFPQKIIRLKENNYVSIIRAYVPDPATWIIKFDENGSLIWNKLIPFPNGLSTDPRSVVETADGSLYIAAFYQKIPNIGGSVIMKLDRNGVLLWSKECSTGLAAMDLIEKNGILYVAGMKSEEGTVLRLNATDGSLIDASNYMIEGKRSHIYNIAEKNGKFYVGGFSRDWQLDSLKPVVFIFDKDMKLQTVHKFNFTFRRVMDVFNMFTNKDDGYTLVTSNEVYADLLLIKMNDNGSIAWKKQHTRPGSQIPFDALLTEDNGIAGVGANNPQEDYYGAPNTFHIFKTDKDGGTGDCLPQELNAAVYTPPVSVSVTTSQYPFNAVTFPQNDINSLVLPLYLPTTVLCEKNFVPLCTTVKISGIDTICSLQSTYTFKAIRNNGCTTPLAWKMDNEAMQLIGQTDSSITVQFKKAGDFRIVASLADACEFAADSIDVHVLVSPSSLNLGPDIGLCKNSSYTLKAEPGFYSYLWQNGTTSSEQLITTAGTYSVKAVNYCGEEFTASVNVTERPLPAGFMPPDTAICEGETVVLTSLTSFNSYSWSNGSSSRQISVNTPGVYSLLVTDNNGCQAKEETEIMKKNGCVYAVHIPTAFSPNNDGNNDQFKAGVYGILTSFRLVVYNRYGNIVFETTDPSKAWDGRYKGVMQDSGNFVWYCEYSLFNRPGQKKKGSLLLLR